MKKLLPLLVLILFLLPSRVLADIAPPDQPAGANPIPGSEATQVRMLSERVLIDVQAKAPQGSLGQAKVTASFSMRNLGSAVEILPVRFPLSYPGGVAGGIQGNLEIRDFAARVGGKAVTTRRIIGADSQPWAEFDVTFPVESDIQVEVAYLVTGVGEYPFIAFYYILETGAGWQGTIGSADLVLRLPYEANSLNVIFDEELGWSKTTPGGLLSGQEVRWHLEDFEPSKGDNLQVSLVMPAAWNAVLTERANVARNPDDGEAWGRLGKAYKEILFLRKGVRQDAGGQELYRLSQEAYENALERLPKDALWHAGYADLLYQAYYWKEFFTAQPDHSAMLRALEQLRVSIELDPQNTKAIELLEDMKYALPEAVRQEGDTYLLLWLTATPTTRPTFTNTPSQTPLPPTATGTPMPTPTLERSPTETPTHTPQLPTTESAATPEPPSGSPVCGTAALLPLAVIAWVWKRRER